MNTIESIDSTKLLNAIKLVKQDHSKEFMFFEALYQAKFICPILVDPHNMTENSNGSFVLNNDSVVSLVSISDSSGALYLMAFTDRNELSKWNQGRDKQSIVYTFDDYKKILLSDDNIYYGVVINPFGDNIVLKKTVFTGGSDQFQTAKRNESIIIGQPKDYPTRMVEKLKQYFSSNRLVDTAYLLWMVRGQEAGYLLIVGTTASPQKLFPAIGELCKPYLNGKMLDMVPLNSNFAQSSIQDQQPFYKA